jgi:DNA-directed RNA polymerase subunit N (RpoN/RPB10)
MSASLRIAERLSETIRPRPSRLGLPRHRQIPAPVHRPPPAAAAGALLNKQVLLATCIAVQGAPNVCSLSAFQRLMGGQSEGLDSAASAATVHGLPPPLRAAPLAALGGRIMAMPEHERPAAIRAFLACDPGATQHGLLTGLRAAACLGPAGLRNREQTLVGERGMAHAAVANGDSVQAVARRFAISGPSALESLEWVALPIAYRALTAGASVAVVACGLGITSPARRDDLERFATRQIGIPAVQAGEAPDAVAERLGVRHPACRRTLWAHAARRQAAQGLQAQQAALAFGNRRDGAGAEFAPPASGSLGPTALRRGDNLAAEALRPDNPGSALVRRLELGADDSDDRPIARPGQTTVARPADRLTPGRA